MGRDGGSRQEYCRQNASEHLMKKWGSKMTTVSFTPGQQPPEYRGWQERLTRTEQDKIDAAAAGRALKNMGSAFVGKLSGAKNSLLTLRSGIKQTSWAVGHGMARLLDKLAIAGKRIAAAARRSSHASVRDMLTKPVYRTVRPDHVIGPLLNDGDSLAVNGKEIRDYLINNPGSPLFASGNIKITGHTISFMQPETIPGTAMTITGLTLDSRDSHSGEVLGALREVLQDPKAIFGSLAELCAIMTVNDKLNVVKMRTAQLIADQLNQPSVRKALVTPKYESAINSLVAYDPRTDTYKPWFTPTALHRNVTPPGEPAFAARAPEKPVVPPRPPWLSNARSVAVPDRTAGTESTIAGGVNNGAVNAPVGRAGPTVHDAGKSVAELRKLFDKP
ncbi:hypothetical protein [Sodalis sp. C49]|uniref:hypothetical protein n=2 Tax=unclassified Sodalis (in: enterobacteria) TaxID=2636512 RepID=UPI00396590DA